MLSSNFNTNSILNSSWINFFETDEQFKCGADILKDVGDNKGSLYPWSAKHSSGFKTPSVSQ